MNEHKALAEALKQARLIADEFYAMKPNIRKHFSSINAVECALKAIRALSHQEAG